MNVIYDIETYPNCFTLAASHADYPITWQFEISDRVNHSKDIIEWLRMIVGFKGTMIGFNNIGFDYPVLHTLIEKNGTDAATLYAVAMEIINSIDKFSHMIYPSKRFVPQIDLFKIHHFDNKARSTSLKALEFNMRMDNISDLPFPVGTFLNPDQIKLLYKYNAHDVVATKRFYGESLEQIRFREELTAKHGRDFMNHNDTKIGAEIFQMELEKAGVQCYEYGTTGRQPKQTMRNIIVLRQCVPQWVQFNEFEFQRIKDFFNTQAVAETKGVFKDIVARVGGLEFVYGSGGLHASVENEFFQSDDEWMIYDMDVTSLYPSIAIEHNHYPEHLGTKFVDVYRNLRTQRVGYKKGTPENAMLKLALNGVYGKSNDKFSIFYDPLFTMKITIGGQMMISLLAERLLQTEGLRIIQVNTDGITVRMRRDTKMHVDLICQQWEQETKLTLEYVEYSKMIIRDVNNYIAVKLNGETKRKGAYEYDLEWHQNGSALIVPKVAEQVLVHDTPIADTVRNWPDKMDFMSRVKVPRNSKLMLVDDDGEHQLENTQRYYVSQGGGRLVKVMPPLAKKPDEWRRIGVESGWKVCPCNDIKDAVLPINYDYYIQEVEKLCLSVM